MKLSFVILSVGLFFFSISCTESPTSTGTGGVATTTTLFVGQSDWITVQLGIRIPEGDNVVVDKSYFDYFGVSGFYFIDTTRTVIRFQVYALKLTPGIVHHTISFRYGNRTFEQPVSVNIIDFYLASTFETNAPDTVELKKGTNFILEVTCKDTAGNIVSKERISRLTGGLGYGTNSNKVVVSGLYQDTTHFAFLLSALPNITAGPEDSGIYFGFSFSNKQFQIPITLKY